MQNYLKTDQQKIIKFHTVIILYYRYKLWKSYKDSLMQLWDMVSRMLYPGNPFLQLVTRIASFRNLLE